MNTIKSAARISIGENLVIMNHGTCGTPVSMSLARVLVLDPPKNGVRTILRKTEQQLIGQTISRMQVRLLSLQHSGWRKSFNVGSEEGGDESFYNVMRRVRPHWSSSGLARSH
jgi:hypothetical protein